MRIVAACFAACLALSTPARADWGDTRWGMSLTAVDALHPGGKGIGSFWLIVLKPGEFRGIAYRSLSFTFLETGEGLESVSIESTEPAAELRRKLTAHYGPVTSTTRSGFARIDTFRDRASRDEITLVEDTRTDWRPITWRTGRPLRVPVAVAAGAPPSWRVPLTEFQANFPSARLLGEGSIFWGMDSPNLHGRVWRRGVFSFGYERLDQYTLVSNESEEAVAAELTARYGPPRSVGGGREFRDPASKSVLTVRRNADGTATVVVYPSS